MAEMNIWEAKFAASLAFRGFDAYRPVKDQGVDLLALNKDTHSVVRFQVKGSKLHGGGINCENCGHSVSGDGGGWFDLDLTKMRKQADLTDFYVFLWPAFGSRGRAELRNYLIVPTPELLRRIESPNYPMRRISRGHYRPWFVKKGEYVLDLSGVGRRPWQAQRDTDADFTNYYRRWADVDELCRVRARFAIGA